ncbi:hypothetical protein [Geobacter sp. DSM 9736]|uniref:hypothetical protein n=1 Tax=Geobacter sp. DSM 9736 TaxID=1277350 RepID=UPI000B5035BD|nr:hypothetical protein [Geobacter sp. DSM 9736]SNB44959.1 hypothetical protein SAMN06269301_0351 [Geobacter sp. DSM 9736]
MNIRFLLSVIISLSLATIFGCGGGGSSGGPSATVVSGTAAKGPINGGTVNIYAVRSGAVDRSAPLGTFTPTPASGVYSVNIGSYTGPVLIEVTGGSYTDEATGAQLDISAVPLRAFVGSASGNVSASVTALTEIAAKRVVDSGAPITPSLITSTNSDVGATFGVADIIGTQPVDAAAAGASGASQPQQEYGMALAALSKYMQQNTRTLGQSVADFTAPATADLLSKLNTARTAFIVDPDRNRTAITGNRTATRAILKLSTAGALTASNSVGSVEVVINLPQGVSIPLQDAGTGEIATSALTLSGAIPSNATILSGKFTPATLTSPATIMLVLASVSGFPVGEFVTVNCDVATGSVVTPAHFILTGFQSTDILGAALTGVTPALAVTFQ